jgi:hypothetical protein
MDADLNFMDEAKEDFFFILDLIIFIRIGSNVISLFQARGIVVLNSI